MRVRPSRPGAGIVLAFVIVAGLLGGFRPTQAADGTPSAHQLYRIDIAGLGRPEVDAWKGAKEVDRWLEMGDALVVVGPASLRILLDKSGTPHELLDPAFDATAYRILASRDPEALNLVESFVRTIVSAGGFRLVRVVEGRDAALAALENFRFQVGEFPGEDLVLHGLYRGTEGGKSLAAWDPEIQAVVDAFDQAYLIGRTQALTQIRSRYSLHASFFNATNYVVAEYGSLGLATELDPFVVQTRTVDNVIAEIPGLLHPDDVYILCGHYDTYQDFQGADDNASGAATTLAIAKVFAQKRPLSTIRFVDFAAEEQGLVGSNHFVGDLLARRDQDKIQGVINMDMIAYENRTDGKIDVLLEGRTRISQRLMDDLAASARDYTTLETPSISYNPFGSDHIPFLNRNLPTLLTIENEDGANPYYHTSQDVYATLNETLHREISKMNLATLAKMAGVRDADDAVAPGAVVNPSITSVTHSAITLSWTSSGDDGAAGRASAYDVRHAPAPILAEFDFANATPAGREPKPSPSGTPQSFTVMGLPAGTHHCLSVKAIDDNLNASALPPETLCATTDPVAVAFSDDAESGTGGWTADAAWHRDAYRNRTPGGTYSWKCGGLGSAFYANSLNASLVSPYVTLGPGSVLQFWHRMLAKESTDTDSPDGGIVEIQTAGGTGWTQITPTGGYNYAHVGGPFPAGSRLFAGSIPWKEENFDLSSWSGSVRFRFRFGSNASSAWEGWYIDDIAVVSQVVPAEVPVGAGGEPALGIGKSGSDLSFTWGPVAGADFYNLYRGSLSSLAGGAYDHVCLQGNVPGTATTRPDPGGDAYFLVTAQNHAGEGLAGRDSSGIAIAIDPGGRCVP